MNERLILIFQEHILRQCKYAVVSVRMMNDALDQNYHSATETVEHVFFGIQSFLNSTANISKALFGGGGQKVEERRPLRESLNVDDDSLWRGVSMRNKFEHIDERLDRWFLETGGRFFVDSNIGPNSMISNMPTLSRFRHYDPATKTITFWGDEFNVQDMTYEVTRLAAVAQKRLADSSVS